jgi:hypothetical protein
MHRRPQPEQRVRESGGADPAEQRGEQLRAVGARGERHGERGREHATRAPTGAPAEMLGADRHGQHDEHGGGERPPQTRVGDRRLRHQPHEGVGGVRDERLLEQRLVPEHRRQRLARRNQLARDLEIARLALIDRPDRLEPEEQHGDAQREEDERREAHGAAR